MVARETLRVEHRESTRKLDEQSGELREGLRTEGSAVKRELDAAARSLREAIAASAAHRDTIERAAELAVGRVQAGAGEQTLEVERLVRRAESVLRDHRHSLETLTSEIEARLESARDRAADELGRASAGATERAREIETSLSSRIAAAQSAASTLLGLEHATEEADRLLESIESRGESIRERIAAVVEEACAERLEPISRASAEWQTARSQDESDRASLRATVNEQRERIERLDRENAELRVALELAEAKQDAFRSDVKAQGDRLMEFENRLAELMSRPSEPLVEADAPEPEPLVPVVVKPKPRKKAPTRKKAAGKTKATAKPTTTDVGTSPAAKAARPAASRKKAAKAKPGDTVVEALAS